MNSSSVSTLAFISSASSATLASSAPKGCAELLSALLPLLAIPAVLADLRGLDRGVDATILFEVDLELLVERDRAGDCAGIAGAVVK